MARFRRARKSYRFASRKARRYGKRHSGMAGVTGDIMSGAIVGIGAQFAAPYVNQFVPSIAGVSPMNVALLGGGIASKVFLHKGGKIADAAIIIGAANVAAGLASGMTGSTSSGGGMTFY